MNINQNLLIIFVFILFLIIFISKKYHTNQQKAGGPIRLGKEGDACSPHRPCDPCLSCYRNVCVVPRTCFDFLSCDMQS